MKHKKQNPILISLDLEMSGQQLFTKYPHEGGLITNSAMFLYPVELWDKNSPKKLQDAPLRRYVPNSILSIGACAVSYFNKKWTTKKGSFYTELKPISFAFDQQAMLIGCKGLTSLKEEFDKSKDQRLNPNSDKFDGRESLFALKNSERTIDPRLAIAEFERYVQAVTPEGNLPILAAAPIRSDAGFLDFYLSLFGSGKSPFYRSPNILGWGGIDIGSLYKGAKKTLSAHLSDINLRKKEGLTHNALEDAIQQAEELCYVLNKYKIKPL